jgi:hypothetical protein
LLQLLKANDVAVAPGSVAQAIVVNAPLHWTSAHRLMLDAFTSIAINRTIAVEGTGALTLTTNDGGSGGDYGFGGQGNVEFWNTSDNLTINGTTFTLVADLPTLIADIGAGHGSGAFALVSSYDASVDGTYGASPIQANFAGIFEGLGNAIENLSISSASGGAALFKVTTNTSVLRHVSLTNVSVTGAANTAGALVAVANGYIEGVAVSGQVQSTTITGDIGGLVGVLEGTLSNSTSSVAAQGGDGTGNLFVGSMIGEMFGGHAILSLCAASGAVTIGKNGWAGGLVGASEDNGDAIDQCYATGQVTGGTGGSLGGLVGLNAGSIAETFATGAVTGGNASSVGGLIGNNRGFVSQTYSTGPLSAGTGSFVGGLIGSDQAPGGSISDSYWDTDTSGVSDLGKGAGNRKNDPGIAGLTTLELQSGLPAGFDPAVWGESANINNGLPYLLALPGP